MRTFLDQRQLGGRCGKDPDLSGPLACLALCASLLGCTVGPDFKAPQPPTGPAYPAPTIGQTPGATPSDIQSFEPGRDIPADWWSLFHSEPLDTLIKRSLASNPNLQSAQAALRAAMENVKAQLGNYYPTVTAGFSANRSKDAAQLSPTLASSALLYNLYQGQLSASWSLDIWGANRRQVEALQAQVDAQRFELQATYVAIASNIVAAAILEASLREQISATGMVIADEQQILDIEQHQKTLGQIDGVDLAAQEAALAQAKQSLPSLQKQLAEQRDLLTTLSGNLPADEIEERFALSSLQLPAQLPLSLPSKLVEQRSDIRVAEANLHMASAEVGVAVANMLPNITLSATDGTVATRLGQLLTPGNGFWSLGVGVTQPIFEGGTLLHRSRAARAVYDQTAAQYRNTVLTAFQNVADTLHAIQFDGEAMKAASEAELAASKSFDIARKQLALGQVNRVALLNAEQSYQQARIALIQAKASRFTGTASLFQALGGGWWNRADPADQTAATGE
jgi:NodT family efflux transporter outer membrane factor (OMF) lipoprotein